MYGQFIPRLMGSFGRADPVWKHLPRLLFASLAIAFSILACGKRSINYNTFLLYCRGPRSAHGPLPGTINYNIKRTLHIILYYTYQQHQMANKTLITAAGGRIGGVSTHVIDLLLKKGAALRALVHKDDERAGKQIHD